jgi:hypothetical protein
MNRDECDLATVGGPCRGDEGLVGIGGDFSGEKGVVVL